MSVAQSADEVQRDIAAVKSYMAMLRQCLSEARRELGVVEGSLVSLDQVTDVAQARAQAFYHAASVSLTKLQTCVEEVSRAAEAADRPLRDLCDWVG